MDDGKADRGAERCARHPSMESGICVNLTPTVGSDPATQSLAEAHVSVGDMPYQPINGCGLEYHLLLDVGEERARRGSGRAASDYQHGAGECRKRSARPFYPRIAGRCGRTG